MKAARLYVGDKVKVGFDDVYLYIVRSKDTGYTLSTTGPKGSTESHARTHYRACVKMQGYTEREWPEHEVSVEDVIMDYPQYTVVIPRREMPTPDKSVSCEQPRRGNK